MNKQHLLRGFLLFLMVGWSVHAAGGTCPLGAIASDSDLLTVPTVGMVAIEVCVTRDGLEDTYTYRITKLGMGATDLCGLLVSGPGNIDTVGMSAPTGWHTSADDVSSDCATWWTWSTLSSFGGGGILRGRTVILSVTVEGPTAPVDVPAALAVCGKGETVPFRILGPSACSGLAEAGASGTCVCSEHGCVAERAFEGDGTRISILGGPDTQVLPQCDASWVRHGWVGVELDPDSVGFRLFIDGVPVGLDRQVLCGPSSEVGVPTYAVHYYKQFGAFFFDVGIYEVMGEWEYYGTSADPIGFDWSRTITLIVEPCEIEPLPIPLLPDLSVRIANASCACHWTPQQERECVLSVPVIIENVGDASADPSNVRMLAGHAMAVKAIPELEAGETYTTELTATFTAGHDVGGPCPLEVDVTADFTDLIAESDENNNQDEAEVCCQ
jgi:hypothetical protein